MPFLVSRAEYRKIGLVVLVAFIVSHLRRKQASRRWLGRLKKDDTVESEEPRYLVDHPFVPYLLENSYLFLAPLAIRKIGVLDVDRPFATFLTFVVKGFVTVNAGLLFQKFLAEVLYSHVPYFTNTKPSNKWTDVVKDYVKCNLPVDIVMGAVQLGLFRALSTPKAREAGENMQFKVFPFLGKLLMGRLIVDVTFYLAHRWLHTDFGYKMIHYRHHEHTGPRLQTNYHFFPTDLFLEAAVPTIVNAFAMHGLKVPLSPYEEEFFGHFWFYFDAGSHTGKEAPVVTWFPPLSPLVDALTNVDQRLIEYHTRHHQFYNCNYSISPWPDKIMGS